MTTTPHAELPAHMVFIDQSDDSTFGSITDDAWGRDESSELKLGAPLYTAGQMHAYGEARERALLARLGDQQPVAYLNYAKKKPDLRTLSFEPLPEQRMKHNGWEAVPLYAHPPAAQPADTSQALRARITEWRKLAQQFDAQRMSALWHLQALLGDPTGHAEAAGEFLAAKPAAQPVAQGGRPSDDDILTLAQKHGLGRKMRPIGMQTGDVFHTDSAYRTDELLSFAEALLAAAPLARACRAAHPLKPQGADMTDKERIARLAREAQVYAPMGAAPTDWWVANIERFAELVATSALQEAHAELDALRADAERYRWLRDKADFLRKKEGSPQVVLTNEWGEIISLLPNAYPRGEKLDAAIDTACKEGAQHAQS